MAQGSTPELQKTGFVRLPIVLAYIPVSKSTWWAGVREGRFPQPVKLGPRVTAWRVEDIRQLIEQLTAGTFGDSPSISTSASVQVPS